MAFGVSLSLTGLQRWSCTRMHVCLFLRRNDAGHLNVVLRSSTPVPRGKPRASLLRSRAI